MVSLNRLGLALHAAVAASHQLSILFDAFMAIVGLECAFDAPLVSMASMEARVTRCGRQSARAASP